MKRIVSLILVLALVVSILALPAQAATLGTGLLIGVAATSVVASALIGLGVLPGSDGSVFDGIVNDAVAHLQSLGFGDGTTIPVLKYLGTGGGIRYALQTGVLNALRSWLWSDDIISLANLYSLSSSEYFQFADEYSSSFYSVRSSKDLSAFYMNYNGATYFVLLIDQTANGQPTFWISGGGTLSPTSDTFYSTISGSLHTFRFYYSIKTPRSSNPNITPYFVVPYSSYKSLSSAVLAVFDGSVSTSSPSLSSSYDVSLGDVASEDEEISVAYPSWGYGSVEIPASGDDEDPDPFIPVTLLPTYDETKGLTQDQAQSGESSLETDNNGTSVDVSGDVGGSITPDGGGGDLPEGESYPTVSDLTTMFAWLASSIDRSVELLFPDLQVIKTYLKALAQWEENKDVQLTSILSYLSGFDTDIDTMLTNLSNIDVNVTSMLTHAENSVSILTGIASDVKDIRDVIADPLDADINESQQDNKTAFLDNFANKSQADNIGDLGGLSGGMTDWFKLDNVDITSMFDQVDTGFGRWFTSETAQSISVGGGAAAAGIGVGLMDDAEYVEPETPYLDAYTQEVQDILAGGDGEW